MRQRRRGYVGSAFLLGVIPEEEPHEVVEFAQHYHGKDLNNDGEPDFGLCFPTAQGGSDSGARAGVVFAAVFA